MGFWVTCGVKMMSICHGWGWQPPQPLLPASILDMYKVFEYNDVLTMGIRSSLKHLYPHYLAQILGFWVTFWSQNDVITSWLRLPATSNCFLHPSLTYTKCLSTLICCPWAYGSSLKQLYLNWLRFWGTWSLKLSKDGITSWLRLTATSNCFPDPQQTYKKCLSTLMCCP